MNEKKPKKEDKKIALKEIWYKQDSERKREAILDTVEAGESFATTLKEIVLYNQHLHDELRWIQSVITVYLQPQIEAGRTKEEIWEEWETIILNKN